MIITCAAAGQEVHVHFDKPHYFAGEYLFYSLTFSDISADSSCIAQIELGNTGAQIDRHFAQILEGKSAGYVKIPYDISSEVYFFSIDLFDNSGAKFQILQTAISVYNPEAAEWLEEQVVASQQQEADRTFGSLSITYAEEPYRTRQRVKCIIQAENASDLSISIRDKVLYPVGDKQYSHDKFEPVTDQYLNTIPIHGKRTAPAHIVWNPLLFVANAPTLEFEICMVGKDSFFQVGMPAFYGRQHIDFIDYVWDDIEIKLMTSTRSYPSETLQVTTPILDQIKLYEQRKKIYRIYNTVEQTPMDEEMEPTTIAIEPDYQLNVPDFAIQGTVLNLFKELLAPLKFRKGKDGMQQARMVYNADDGTHFYNSTTKFLVNGHLTRDGDFISQIPLQEVAFITIYHELDKVRSHFGPIGTGGIVVIEMKDKTYSLPADIRMPSHPVQGLQEPIDYPIKVEQDAGGPQLKSLIYWQPSIRTNDQGRHEFEFVTSDDLSTFEIEVLAKDHTGKVTLNHRIYEVSSINAN